MPLSSWLPAHWYRTQEAPDAFFLEKNAAPFELAQSKNMGCAFSDLRGDGPGKSQALRNELSKQPGETSMFANAVGVLSGFFEPVFLQQCPTVSLFSLIAPPFLGASMELQLKPNISTDRLVMGEILKENDRRASGEMIHVILHRPYIGLI